MIDLRRDKDRLQTFDVIAARLEGAHDKGAVEREAQRIAWSPLTQTRACEQQPAAALSDSKAARQRNIILQGRPWRALIWVLRPLLYMAILRLGLCALRYVIEPIIICTSSPRSVSPCALCCGRLRAWNGIATFASFCSRRDEL